MLKLMYRRSQAPFWRGLRKIFRYKNAILTVILLMVILLTASVHIISRGLDAEFERQDAVMVEHFREHGIDR